MRTWTQGCQPYSTQTGQNHAVILAQFQDDDNAKIGEGQNRYTGDQCARQQHGDAVPREKVDEISHRANDRGNADDLRGREFLHQKGHDRQDPDRGGHPVQPAGGVVCLCALPGLQAQPTETGQTGTEAGQKGL